MVRSVVKSYNGSQGYSLATGSILRLNIIWAMVWQEAGGRGVAVSCGGIHRLSILGLKG